MTILVWIVALVFVSLSEGKRNRFYTFPSSCSSYTREIDGAVIQSTGTLYGRSGVCSMRFKADDFLGQIHVQLKNLVIPDCKTKLRFSTLSRQYSCKDKNFTTNWRSHSRYLTIDLENGSRGEKFQIILSATPHGCEFRCYQSGYCIDRDLRCDGIDHCVHGEDEKKCSFGGKLASGATAGVVIGVIVLIIIVIAVLVVCVRRRRQRYASHQPVTMQQAPAPVVYQAQQAYPQPGSYPQQPAAYPQQPVGYGYPPTGPPPQGYNTAQAYGDPAAAQKFGPPPQAGYQGAPAGYQGTPTGYQGTPAGVPQPGFPPQPYPGNLPQTAPPPYPGDASTPLASATAPYPPADTANPPYPVK